MCNIQNSNAYSIAIMKHEIRAEAEAQKEAERKAEEEAEAKAQEEAERAAEEEIQESQNIDCYVSSSDFMVQGVIYENGIKYTWYSENVLPGDGLDIPGRHTDYNGYVCDCDGYICVASCDYSYGTILSTPFGMAKVYDVCPISGIVDVYVSW